MSQVIEIDLIETGLSEEQLLAALQAHLDDLENLTLGDSLEFRATIDDGTFALESVERVPPPSVSFHSESFALSLSESGFPTNLYLLNYRFDWSAYRGCSNADDADTTQSSARFSYRNGIVRFEFEEYCENAGE